MMTREQLKHKIAQYSVAAYGSTMSEDRCLQSLLIDDNPHLLRIKVEESLSEFNHLPIYVSDEIFDTPIEELDIEDDSAGMQLFNASTSTYYDLVVLDTLLMYFIEHYL